MRLLHQRHGDGREGAAGEDAAPHRGAGEGRARRHSLPLRHAHAHPARGSAREPGVRTGAMTAIPALSRRDLLKAGGALVVSFSLEAAWPVRAQTAATLKTDLGKTVNASEVDGFLAVHPDGSVTVFSGKVDLGTGFRIAVRQIVAEELDLPVERIAL